MDNIKIEQSTFQVLLSPYCPALALQGVAEVVSSRNTIHSTPAFVCVNPDSINRF